MLKKIAIALIVVIAAILGLAAIQPDTFRVERKLQMKASPAKVHAQLNDFHNWGAWSPWEKLDPAMKRIHSGPLKGKGAAYAWEGNKQVGSGRMEILETSADKIVVKLTFLMPFEAHNTAIYSFTPKDGGTELSWAMEGPMNFFSKVICVFASMDKLIGKDFEAGLNNIKAIVEK